ncbi:hypothetical protein G3I76_17920, partial [Streptomyces sp. SID11233]|nr:hypothetical protein [Streptomyces sp. SID11233]
APAMAIARNCLDWSRAFLARRAVDGRRLGEYDEIQRIVTAGLADVYAMETAARWSLLTEDLGARWLERFLTKNLLVRGAWRMVDRTVSLHGGEGYETVASKKRRGAPPVPVERAFRDARGLRVAGNVDFQLDNQLGRMVLDRFYTMAVSTAPASPAPATPAGRPPASGFPPLLREDADHLAALVRQVRELAEGLVRDQPDPARLYAGEHTVVLLGRALGELFNAVAVLARASAEDGTTPEQPWQHAELAAVYVREARHRVEGLLARLRAQPRADHAAISRRWLAAPDDQLVRH